MKDAQKKLADLSYNELIDRVTIKSLESIVSGTPLKDIQQLTIDLTIAWLREKGKLKG
jgi:hypothetical protein